VSVSPHIPAPESAGQRRGVVPGMLCGAHMHEPRAVLPVSRHASCTVVAVRWRDEACCTCLPSGLIVLVSRCAEGIFGCPSTSLVGQNLADLLDTSFLDPATVLAGLQPGSGARVLLRCRGDEAPLLWAEADRVESTPFLVSCIDRASCRARSWRDEGGGGLLDQHVFPSSPDLESVVSRPLAHSPQCVSRASFGSLDSVSLADLFRAGDHSHSLDDPEPTTPAGVVVSDSEESWSLSSDEDGQHKHAHAESPCDGGTVSIPFPWLGGLQSDSRNGQEECGPRWNCGSSPSARNPLRRRRRFRTLSAAEDGAPCSEETRALRNKRPRTNTGLSESISSAMKTMSLATRTSLTVRSSVQDFRTFALANGAAQSFDNGMLRSVETSPALAKMVTAHQDPASSVDTSGAPLADVDPGCDWGWFSEEA